MACHLPGTYGAWHLPGTDPPLAQPQAMIWTLDLTAVLGTSSLPQKRVPGLSKSFPRSPPAAASARLCINKAPRLRGFQRWAVLGSNQ
jgi:hypothetical protein